MRTLNRHDWIEAGFDTLDKVGYPHTKTATSEPTRGASETKKDRP